MRRILDEAFYGNKKYGKRAPSDPNATRKGRIQIDHGAVETKRRADGSEREVIAIYLGHVFADGADKLISAINSKVPPTVMVARPTTGGRSKVVLYVNPDKVAEIPSVVQSLGQAIRSLDDYDDSSIEKLCSDVFDHADSVATSSDVESAEKRKIGNWKDMLTRLQDPDVRKALLMYQTTDNYARQYGHVLSPANVKSVLDQCPTASFVTERSTWRSKFNRSVNPGAQRIVVTKPVRGFTGANVLDDAAREAGYESFADARKKTNGSPQVLGRIKNIASSKSASKYQQFIKVVMYDVADTTPNDPNHDIWTETIGLSNNLNGIINDMAAKFDQEMGDGTDSAAVAANKATIETAKKMEMPNRRKQMEMLCNNKRLGVNIDTSVFADYDDANFIARAMLQYAKAIAPAYGLVIPGQIEKVANMCAIAICLSSGIDLNAVDKVKLAYPNNATEEEAMHAFTICDKVLPKLSNAVRPQKITMINQESKENNGELVEAMANDVVSFSDFAQMVKSRYGDGSEDMAANEARERIHTIVSEEISRILRNRK